MEEIVYLNGDLISRKLAKISVTDYGFLYGYGLFETMRAYNGVVFRLDNHLDRLANSIKLLRIPVDGASFKSAVTETLRANRLKEARIRLAVSLGEGSPAPDLSSCGQPTVLVIATAYLPHNLEIYEKGFKTKFSSIRRNSQSPIPQMKTANYLENLLSRREALAGGVDDVLLINEIGFLAEASTSNVFLVSNNILKTPRKENGILPGITRDIILELADQSGIEALEVDIRPEELLEADEIFLTNSIIEVMPVTEIDGNMIRSGKPGLMTLKLMESYRDIVRRETSTYNTGEYWAQA